MLSNLIKLFTTCKVQNFACSLHASTPKGEKKGIVDTEASTHYHSWHHMSLHCWYQIYRILSTKTLSSDDQYSLTVTNRYMVTRLSDFKISFLKTL
jgi:hypothetical protein